MDQEIRDLEIIHQQVQRKKEKMARLADLQRKIDEATEEVRQLAQDDQDALQPLDTNQDTLSLSERPEAKRERPPVQHFRRRSWTRRSET